MLTVCVTKYYLENNYTSQNQRNSWRTEIHLRGHILQGLFQLLLCTTDVTWKFAVDDNHLYGGIEKVCDSLHFISHPHSIQ
jgi:hypothetical protein